MRRSVVLMLISLGILLHAPAAKGATSVSGVVQRPPAAAPQTDQVNRYRERTRVRETNVDIPGASCECNPGVFAVVHLTGEALPETKLPLAPPVMAQKDRMFVPSVVAVPVGGTVTFPNYDPFFHNVFSYSKTRKFDLGRYPKGEAQDVRFEASGVVPIFCEIHYSMRAYIHVFETPYFAVSDESRRFEIPEVSPGEYVLHVWQENLPEVTMPITVGHEPLYVEIP